MQWHNKGAKIYAKTPAQRIVPTTSGYDIATPNGTVSCNKFIIATNGYSSEDMFHDARTLFARPVVRHRHPTDHGSEQTAQGWTSAQMAYDSRFLHYFRLMPNNRFPFKCVDCITPNVPTNGSVKKSGYFSEMFPAWRDVTIDYEWSGLVALNRSETPYIGEIPGYAGGYAGFGYHGNGVAMASYAGALLSDLILIKSARAPTPRRFNTSPGNFHWAVSLLYACADLCAGPKHGFMTAVQSPHGDRHISGVRTHIWQNPIRTREVTGIAVRMTHQIILINSPASQNVDAGVTWSLQGQAINQRR